VHLNAIIALNNGIFEKPKDFKAWWTVGGYRAHTGRAKRLCLFYETFEKHPFFARFQNF